jgi:hypothetical protein
MSVSLRAAIARPEIWKETLGDDSPPFAVTITLDL